MGYPGFEATSVFFALAYAQLGVLCIWSVLFHAKVGIRWLVPFGGGVVVGIVFGALVFVLHPSLQNAWSDFLEITAYMWLFTAFVVALLWLLKYGRLFGTYSISECQQRWRFGVKHMLVLMTCVAVLLLMFKRFFTSDGLDLMLHIIVPWSAASAVLPVTGAIANHFRQHWVLRLATILSCALVIGACCAPIRMGLMSGRNLYAYFLIQAVVIWAWLETLCASHAGSKGVTDEIATAGASQ